MKKRLTRDSFSALRETVIVLDEQEQRTVKGGDYWDDHGYYTTDSSGNFTWTRTSDDGYYGSGSDYDSGTGTIYTQSQYFNWSGSWNGGYVEGLGYVASDYESATNSVKNSSFTRYDNYGYYAGSGENHSQSGVGSFLHKVAGETIPGWAYHLGLSYETISNRFNSALGNVMSSANYGAGRAFYIQDKGYGVYIVYNDEGDQLGSMNIRW